METIFYKLSSRINKNCLLYLRKGKTQMVMTDINARIALSKGWICHACGECNHEWWQMPDGGVDYNQSDPPQYTTDWRLAGELLEEVSKTSGWDVSLIWEQVDEHDENNLAYEWTCYMTYWDDDPDNFKTFKASADTPQMAICLAWLEWSER